MKAAGSQSTPLPSSDRKERKFELVTTSSLLAWQLNDTWWVHPLTQACSSTCVCLWLKCLWFSSLHSWICFQMEKETRLVYLGFYSPDPPKVLLTSNPFIQQPLNIVQASIVQCVWSLHIVCSGSAKEAAVGECVGITWPLVTSYGSLLRCTHCI